MDPSTSPHDLTALVAAVRTRAERVGYQVTETPGGFRVERNLADARYWGPLYKAGVRTLTGHEVTSDPATGVLAVTDVQRNVEWRAGNDGVTQLRPFWALHAETSQGRIAAVGTKRSWGVREDGTLGTIEDYSFDTNEGRATIREAAAELGWRERMPLDQRIGLAVAVATVVGLVLCFGGWGLVALLG
jgi:hypothetical protein